MTYTQDFYNLKDHSLALLCSNKQVSEKREDNYHNLDHNAVLAKLEKQKLKNQRGLVNIDRDNESKQLERNMFRDHRDSINRVTVKVKNSH